MKGDAFDHQANNSPKKALPKKSLSDEFKQIVAKDDPSSDQSSEDSFVQYSKVGRNIDKRYACNIRRRLPASGGDEGEKESEVEGSPEYDFLTNSFFTRGESRMAIVHTPQVFEDTHENDELLQLKKHIFCWVQRKKSEPNSKFPKWPWLRDKATIIRRLWKEWKAAKGLPPRGGPKRGGLPKGFTPVLQAFMAMCVQGETRQYHIDSESGDVQNMSEKEKAALAVRKGVPREESEGSDEFDDLRPNLSDILRPGR